MTMKAYRLKDKDGTFARAGLTFGSKKGKIWNGKNALSLAFTNWLERNVGYSERSKLNKEKLREKLFNHAEENGWAVQEITETGSRWLTVREYFSE